MKPSLGVIHGRFQVLHVEHMRYLLEAKRRCEHLIIGVSNPDVALTRHTAANPHRDAPLSNPLTYYERMVMIRGSMVEYGVSLEEFGIVPFPICYPELLFNYVPKEAMFYMTIYDEWSEEKKRALEELGCQVEVMWQKPAEEKEMSATEVRSNIIHDRLWEHEVPKFVYRYIMEHGIDRRLKELAAQVG